MTGDMMELWNTLLSVFLVFAGFVGKFIWNEVQRIQILLNKTREEMIKGQKRECPDCAEFKQWLKSKNDFEANT